MPCYKLQLLISKHFFKFMIPELVLEVRDTIECQIAGKAENLKFKLQLIYGDQCLEMHTLL